MLIPDLAGQSSWTRDFRVLVHIKREFINWCTPGRIKLPSIAFQFRQRFQSFRLLAGNLMET